VHLKKKREIIREWITSGKIENNRDPLTKVEKEGIKQVEKAFGGAIKFADKNE